MRTLVLGAMPAGATSRTHIASGPWCFSGREELFPGWDANPAPGISDGLSAPGGDRESGGAPASDGPVSGTPSASGGAPAGQPGVQPESAPPLAAFPMPDDPYPDALSIEAEAKAANGEVLRLIGLLGAEFDAQSARSRSGRYWQMALGPFLVPAVHMLAERQRRVADLIARYGEEELLVELLPEDFPFSFRTTLDFTVNGIQNVRFNHYVFSRILEAALAAPCAKAIPWRVAYASPGTCASSAADPAATGAPGAADVPPVITTAAAGPAATGTPSATSAPPAFTRRTDVSQRRSFFAGPADRLRRVLRNLPFPRYKGFSLVQSLLLSLAVLCNRRRVHDRRLDFSLYCAGGFTWLFPAEKLIRACLPADLLEGVTAGKAALPENAAVGKTTPRNDTAAGKTPPQDRYARRPSVPGPLRGMTPAYMQDDTYRLRLAGMLESGCRLFCLQHGANYGNLRSVGILPFEYGQHVFFTWGWQQHDGVPANARPLPHPALASLCGAHKETAPRLILVGAEMSPFLYRLKSRPQARAMLTYRERKITFFRCLLRYLKTGTEQTPPTALPVPDNGAAAPEPAISPPQLLYRPYFKVAGGLEDADYVLRRLPEVGLCAGDLTKPMLGCRLLVLDHYGTTLHMALAADVPTLAFWNREEWGMEPQSEAVLDVLHACGILHASPEDAARHAARIWPDPSVWWKSPPVRKARALWLRHYAMVGDSPDRPWSRLTLTGKWFKQLMES